MIDAVSALRKIGLQPGMSVTRAISKIGLDIGESSNQLEAANRIIVMFGGIPMPKPIHADIIAKALIEQAVVLGANYKADEAMVIANDKFSKVERTMPYVFAGSAEETQSTRPSSAKEKKSGGTKDQALAIFNREKGKTNNEIAKIIAAELDITFANAYYYVGRVFAKYAS